VYQIMRSTTYVVNGDVIEVLTEDFGDCPDYDEFIGVKVIKEKDSSLDNEALSDLEKQDMVNDMVNW